MSNFNQMFSSNALMNRLFRKAENVVWDMMTGRIGVVTKEGMVVTLEMTGTAPDLEFQTVENPFEGMSMAVPAFAQQTALDAVKQGDLILKGSTAGWVTEVNAKSVSIIKPDGSHTKFTPPKTQLLDFGSGLMVVRSLLNALPGGQAGLGGMQGMLLPMMMSGMLDGDSMEKIMPMMLMMGGALTTSGNPADAAQTPFAGGMGNMQQMMPMLMMMGMMKGGKGGGMFGGDDDDTSRIGRNGKHNPFRG